MVNMIAKERLYLTVSRKALVREGDAAGVELYCAAGDEIPPSAVELFGLVDGTIAEGGKKSVSGDKVVKEAGGDKGAGGGTKEQGPGQDKEQKSGEDKGAGSGTKGAAASNDTPAADDLTRVKFVGAKVAAGFVAAGLTTFAQIAAIDPAQPPAIEGTNATTKWADIVASAKEIVAPASGDNGQGGGDASGDAGAEAGAADQSGT